MNHQFAKRAGSGAAALGVACVLSAGIAAQQGAARTGASAPTDLAAKATPRTADGHPDLTGTWDKGGTTFGFKTGVDPTASVCVFGNCGRPAPAPAANAAPAPRPAPDFPKYKAELLPKVKQLSDRQVYEDTSLRCMNPGLPRIGAPKKVVQTPGQVVFLYDDLTGFAWRIVPTDGRPHRKDVDVSYLGDSVGHWDGDTLVVETTKFNAETWLIDNGAFHTENLRVVETFKRVGDTIQYQATAYDPEVLAEPWAKRPLTLKLTTEELIEPAPCLDKSIPHLVNLEHHDNGR
jgi:hypothetical protein